MGKGRRKPLIGGGKKKAISGRETKKGIKGIASNYIHRTKAVRRLQVSLKDFRRLCILKGIYPRDPKKKPHGNDKTYYHIKDIKFLMHEPLLQKFRDMKVFVKRYQKAMTRKEFSIARNLEKTMKPTINFDHLVKERYPSFVDAIRDLDDPLSMIALFSLMPSKTCEEHEAKLAVDCSTLMREFQHWVLRMKALRKVFVSIKGIYFQVRVYGQDVTWLMPHKFKQQTPRDVDFRVMLTFLQFYITLVRFVNFKLYYDIGLRYPPALTEDLEANGANLASFKLEQMKEPQRSIVDDAEMDMIDENDAVSTKEQEKLQEAVTSLATKLDSAEREVKESTGGDDMEEDDGEDAFNVLDEKAGEENDEEKDFNVLDAKDEENKNSEQTEEISVFKGLVILLGRETPQDALEFVILGGGGEVLRESEESRDSIVNERVTHQIVDRPRKKHQIFSRQYAQPQWIFDSFNVRALLPIQHYAVGNSLPPHLSPFVDDEKEGYIPRQKEILKSWGGKMLSVAAKAEEARSKEELDERELAKIMMTNKKRKLYDKIQFGMARKNAANQKLIEKRQEIESKKSIKS